MMEWDVIARYISGKASEEEKNAVALWAKGDEKRRGFLKDALEFYRTQQAAHSFEESDYTAQELPLQESDLASQEQSATEQSATEPHLASQEHLTTQEQRYREPHLATQEQRATETQRAWNRINPARRRRIKLYKYSAAAAAVALIIISALTLINPFSQSSSPLLSLFGERSNAELPHIKPGEERASLLLANNQVVELGPDAQQMQQLKGVSIKKEAETKKATLVIDVTGRGNEELYKLNEIVVPKYAEYQINLEEGTRVWLNSETKMKFPLKFAEGERVVYISGEAYFQVAHNPKRPFIVHLDDKTQIKVLGTEFNIRTYEENLSQSTLISGSIELIHDGVSTMVEPGKSCIVNKNTGEVTLQEADLMSVTSWKNGEFVFRNETLENIIKELSRWYQVEVKFESDNLKEERFYLYCNRTTGFEEIMYQIRKTGRINYSYKNKSIVIY